MDELDYLPMTKPLYHRRKSEEITVATRRDVAMSTQSAARTVRVVCPKIRPSSDSP